MATPRSRSRKSRYHASFKIISLLTLITFASQQILLGSPVQGWNHSEGSPSAPAEKISQSSSADFSNIPPIQSAAASLDFLKKENSVEKKSIVTRPSPDREPPTGSIEINQGARATNKREVELKLTAQDDRSGVTGMQFWTSETKVWSDWENFQPAKKITFQGAFEEVQGEKEIRVRFRDKNNNQSVEYKDTIILDFKSPTGSVFIPHTNGYVQSPKVLLEIQPQDLSGIAVIELSTDGQKFFPPATPPQRKNTAPGSPQDSTLLVPVDLPVTGRSNTVTVRLHDYAGNPPKDIVSNAVLLDMTKPAGQLLIEGGAPVSKIRKVELTLNVKDTGSGLDQMRINLTNQTAGEWEPWQKFSPKVFVNLSGGPGRKTVRVEVQDLAGNKDTFWDTIELDKNLLEIQPIGDIPKKTRESSLTVEYSFNEQKLSKKFDLEAGNHPYTITEQDPTTKQKAERTLWIERVTTPPPGTLRVVDANEHGYTNKTEVEVRFVGTGTKAGVDQVRFWKEQEKKWGEWEKFEETKKAALTSQQGEQEIKAEIREPATGLISPYAAKIKLDSQKPHLSVTINNDWNTRPLVRDPKIYVTIQAWDPLPSSGIDKVKYFVVGQTHPAEWEPFVGGKELTLLPREDGVQTIGVEIRDKAGNVQRVEREVELRQNTLPITILKHPPRRTRDSKVFVEWKFGTATIGQEFELTEGKGVCALLKEESHAGGSVFECVVKQSDVHTEKPVEYKFKVERVTAPPPGKFEIQNVQEFTTREPEARFIGTEANTKSTTHKMRFSLKSNSEGKGDFTVPFEGIDGTENSKEIPWEPFTAAKKLTFPTKGAYTVYAQIFEEDTGLISEFPGVVVRVDTTLPTGGVKINEDAPLTRSSYVDLTLRAQDGKDGEGDTVSGLDKDRLRYSVDGGKTWVPVRNVQEGTEFSVKEVDLPGPDGVKKVLFEVWDKAGNRKEFADEIQLNTEGVAKLKIVDPPTQTRESKVEVKYQFSTSSGSWPFDLVEGGENSRCRVIGTNPQVQSSVFECKLEQRDSVKDVLVIKKFRIEKLPPSPKGKLVIGGEDQPWASTKEVQVKFIGTDTEGTPGVDKVRFWEDRILDQETGARGGWGPEQTFKPTMTVTLSGPDGKKEVKAQIKATSGLVSEYSDEIYLDDTTPEARIEINGSTENVQNTKTRKVKLEFFAEDPCPQFAAEGQCSKLDKVRYWLPKDKAWTDWQDFPPWGSEREKFKTYYLPDADGPHLVKFEAGDHAGNIQHVEATILLSQEAKILPQDDPRKLRRSREDQMVIPWEVRTVNPDGTLAPPSSWCGQDCASHDPCKLEKESSNDCTLKTTYNGVEIVYPLFVQKFTKIPAGKLEIEKIGNKYATSPVVKASFKVEGIELDPEFDKICISTDGGATWCPDRDPTKELWTPFSKAPEITLKGPDGEKYVKIKVFEDLQFEYEDKVILDTTPPVGSIFIPSGRTHTPDRQVNVTFDVTDVTSQKVTKMRVSTDGVNFSDPPLNFSRNDYKWDLVGEDGLKWIYAHFQDEAGNWTKEPLKQSITLDTKDPQIEGDPSVTIFPNRNRVVQIRVSGNESLSFESKITVWPVSNPQQRQTFSAGGGSGSTAEFFIPELQDLTKYQYEAVVADLAGNRSSSRQGEFETTDITAPQTKIAPPSFGTVTNQPNLTFQLSAEDNHPVKTFVYHYELFRCTLSATECESRQDAFKPVSGGTISNGSGLALPEFKTDGTEDGVYKLVVKAEDGSQNTDSKGASWSWWFDTIPPQGTVRINSGHLLISDSEVHNVKLKLSADGIGSKVTEMRFSTDNGKSFGNARPYQEEISFPDILNGTGGKRVVYAQFKDEAGNWNQSERFFSQSVFLLGKASPEENMFQADPRTELKFISSFTSDSQNYTLKYKINNNEPPITENWTLGHGENHLVVCGVGAKPVPCNSPTSEQKWVAIHPVQWKAPSVPEPLPPSPNAGSGVSLTSQDGHLLKFSGDKLASLEKPGRYSLSSLEVDDKGNLTGGLLTEFVQEGVTRKTYFKNGKQVWTEDPNKSRTFFNADGSTRNVLSKDGRSTAFAYRTNSPPDLVTTANVEGTAVYGYDAKTQTGKILNALDRTGRLSSFDQGKLQSVQIPQQIPQGVYRYQQDPAKSNRFNLVVLSGTPPPDLPKWIEYDAEGKVVKMENQNQATAEFANGLPVKVKNPGDPEISLAYTPNPQDSKNGDPLGFELTREGVVNEFNAAGNLVSIDLPDHFDSKVSLKEQGQSLGAVDRFKVDSGKVTGLLMKDGTVLNINTNTLNKEKNTIDTVAQFKDGSSAEYQGGEVKAFSSSEGLKYDVQKKEAPKQGEQKPEIQYVATLTPQSSLSSETAREMIFDPHMQLLELTREKDVVKFRNQKTDAIIPKCSEGLSCQPRYFYYEGDRSVILQGSFKERPSHWGRLPSDADYSLIFYDLQGNPFEMRAVEGDKMTRLELAYGKIRKSYRCNRQGSDCVSTGEYSYEFDNTGKEITAVRDLEAIQEAQKNGKQEDLVRRFLDNRLMSVTSVKDNKKVVTSYQYGQDGRVSASKMTWEGRELDSFQYAYEAPNRTKITDAKGVTKIYIPDPAPEKKGQFQLVGVIYKIPGTKSGEEEYRIHHFMEDRTDAEGNRIKAPRIAQELVRRKDDNGTQYYFQLGQMVKIESSDGTYLDEIITGVSAAALPKEWDPQDKSWTPDELKKDPRQEAHQRIFSAMIHRPGQSARRVVFGKSFEFALPNGSIQKLAIDQLGSSSFNFAALSTTQEQTDFNNSSSDFSKGKIVDYEGDTVLVEMRDGRLLEYERGILKREIDAGTDNVRTFAYDGGTVIVEELGTVKQFNSEGKLVQFTDPKGLIYQVTPAANGTFALKSGEVSITIDPNKPPDAADANKVKPFLGIQFTMDFSAQKFPRSLNQLSLQGSVRILEEGPISWVEPGSVRPWEASFVDLQRLGSILSDYEKNVAGPDEVLFSVFDQGGQLVYSVKMDGRTTKYDEKGRIIFVWDRGGLLNQSYKYDGEGNPEKITLHKARQELPRKIQTLRAYVEQQKSEALEAIAKGEAQIQGARVQLGEARKKEVEGIENWYQSQLSQLQSQRSNLEGQRYVKQCTSGPCWTHCETHENSGVAEAINQINGSISSLPGLRDERYRALEAQILKEEKKLDEEFAKLQNERKRADDQVKKVLEDIDAQEVTFRREIIRQEISSILSYFSRKKGTGRDFNKEEFNWWLDHTDYEKGLDVPFLLAVLNGTAPLPSTYPKGYDYKAERTRIQTMVKNVKAKVNASVRDYVRKTQNERIELAKTMFNLSAEDLIFFNESEAEEILRWLEQPNKKEDEKLHFGQSAVISLEAMLRQGGVTNFNREDLLTELILIDIFTGVITPFEERVQNEPTELTISAFAIKHAAQRKGVSTEGLQVAWEDLWEFYRKDNGKNQGRWIITHINDSHFVIVTGMVEGEDENGKKVQKIIYIDPGAGPAEAQFSGKGKHEEMKVGQEEFLKVWKGFALVSGTERQQGTNAHQLAHIREGNPNLANLPPPAPRVLSKEELQKIRGSFFFFLIPFFAAIWSGVTLAAAAVGAFVATTVGTLTAAFGAISAAIQGAITAVVGALNAVAGTFLSVATNLLHAIPFIGPALSGIVGAVGNFAVGFVSGFVTQFASTVLNSFASRFVLGATSFQFLGNPQAVLVSLGVPPKVAHYIDLGIRIVGAIATGNPALIASTLASTAVLEIGPRVGLSPQLTQAIAIAASVVGGAVGQGAFDPTQTVLQALKASAPDIAQSLIRVGVVVLGESVGLDPRLSGLLGDLVPSVVLGPHKGPSLSTFAQQCPETNPNCGPPPDDRRGDSEEDKSFWEVLIEIILILLGMGEEKEESPSNQPPPSNPNPNPNPNPAPNPGTNPNPDPGPGPGGPGGTVDVEKVINIEMGKIPIAGEVGGLIRREGIPPSLLVQIIDLPQIALQEILKQIQKALAKGSRDPSGAPVSKISKFSELIAQLGLNRAFDLLIKNLQPTTIEALLKKNSDLVSYAVNQFQSYAKDTTFKGRPAKSIVLGDDEDSVTLTFDKQNNDLLQIEENGRLVEGADLRFGVEDGKLHPWNGIELRVEIDGSAEQVEYRNGVLEEYQVYRSGKALKYTPEEGKPIRVNPEGRLLDGVMEDLNSGEVYVLRNGKIVETIQPVINPLGADNLERALDQPVAWINRKYDQAGQPVSSEVIVNKDIKSTADPANFKEVNLNDLKLLVDLPNDFSGTPAGVADQIDQAITQVEDKVYEVFGPPLAIYGPFSSTSTQIFLGASVLRGLTDLLRVGSDWGTIRNSLIAAGKAGEFNTALKIVAEVGTKVMLNGNSPFVALGVGLGAALEKTPHLRTALEAMSREGLRVVQILSFSELLNSLVKSNLDVLKSGVRVVDSELAKLLKSEAGQIRIIGESSTKALVTTPWKSKFWTPKVVNGTKVYQRNELINPKLVDRKTGLTNLERMQRGLAAIGSDGEEIVLHHTLQTNDSALVEVTSTFHQQNSKVIHINPNTIPSGINRSAFNWWKKRYYWPERAKDFLEP